LLDIEQDQVRFTYKDYRADPSQAQKTMTLAAEEFIRRFLLHVRAAHRVPPHSVLRLSRRTPSPTQARPLSGTPRLSRAGQHATGPS
jgi:hypothetical protein